MESRGDSMSKLKGRVTLPSESGFLEETKELIDRLGADAIRDSDGTKLSDELKALDVKIYSTYFVARGQNEWAKHHPDQNGQFYLMSARNTAVSKTLEIEFMKGYFAKQVIPDYDHDPKRWWEVINRTTGEIIDVNQWSVDSEKDLVIIEDANEFHEYTVSFLVFAIWDTTQMYNHTTNNWGDSVEHDIPFDARKPKAQQHMLDYMDRWLEENKDTDVVRFTTFFYHFTLVFNEEGKEKFVDWFGYSGSVSTEALEAFEEERGYRLRPEHIIDQGYYKLYKEIDTLPIHLSRILLEISNLVKKRHNKLSLTAAGLKQLNNDQILFENLFQIFTRKFNWSYNDGFENEKIGQMGFSFTIILLIKYGQGFRPKSFYTAKYFQAFPFLMIDEDGAELNFTKKAFEVRTFDRFLDFFGLIEYENNMDIGNIKPNKMFSELFLILPHKNF